MREILIQKMDGTTEPFDSAKLLRSLRRSGSTPQMAQRVLGEIEATLRDGMTTKDIYHRAFDLLRAHEHENPVAAARYSIKRALLELGPSGFPFEQFVADVMRAHGARDVQTGLLLQGKCLRHEVDVVGMAHGKRFGMEVKFHNSLNTKTDSKVALYVKSRWDDLTDPRAQDRVDRGYLVTNTRFTHNVVRYARCSGAFELLGWDYPRKRGLEVLIEEAGLHPLTMLTTLTGAQKRALMDQDKVLCREIINQPDLLLDAGVHHDKLDIVMEQARALCES